MADESPRGVRLLHDPVRNKGTAFTDEEREALRLRGLLPPRVLAQDVQVARVMANLASHRDDLDRYVSLVSLQDRNETLFYRVLVDNLEALMPIVYTPTVGKACQEFGRIFRRPRGIYVSADDRGRVDSVLANWPHDDVRIVVVTDGERILGAGEAGIGIGDQIVAALREEGLALEDARRRCCFFDSKGLVVASRDDLADHKRRSAHEHPGSQDLLAAVRELRPSALIGASGSAGAFTQPVVEALSEINERPILFALSNPTSKSECTARQAYGWSGGRSLGRLYPPLSRVREVSARIATAVAEVAWRQDLARAPRPEDPLAFIGSHMFEPNYAESL